MKELRSVSGFALQALTVLAPAVLAILLNSAAIAAWHGMAVTAMP